MKTNSMNENRMLNNPNMRKWVALLASVTLSCQLHAKYAVFERHTDTIQVAGQTVLEQTATYEAVFLLRGSHAYGGNIFNEWTNGQEDKSLMVSRNNVSGNSYESTVPYAALMSLHAKVTVSTDTWHHVAFVTDSREDRLYLDGKLQAAQPRFAPIQNGSGTAQVGAIYRGGAPGIRGFVGVLDSVRISNVARYNGPAFTPPTGDLSSDTNTVLLFNFNDPATNSVVTDESPLHRTGTMGSGFSGATAPKLIDRLDDLPPAQVRDVVIDPRATYLRVNNDRAWNAIPISLASLGVQPGDTIFLEKIGDCNFTADYETSSDNVGPKVIGVFSGSAALTPHTDRYRVTGAIKAGQDYATPVTGSGSFATDIPEDFLIPDTGLVVTVPENAQFLFVTAPDTKYQDNFDWDGNFGFHISKFDLQMVKSNGNILLNWDYGQLQFKANLSDPWADVPGANSPHAITSGKPAEFFRLRGQ